MNFVIVLLDASIVVTSVSITVRAESQMASKQQIKPLSTTRTIFYNSKCSGNYETGNQGTKKCSLWSVFIGA
jgi:hypothetical protein